MGGIYPIAKLKTRPVGLCGVSLDFLEFGESRGASLVPKHDVKDWLLRGFWKKILPVWKARN
jgi:hypothetical protein